MSLSIKCICACALGATLLVGGTQELSAQQRGGGRGRPLTPLTYRQDLMEQMQAGLRTMSAIRDGTVGAPGDLVGRATIIRELAMALTSAWPEGSGGDDSRSLPAVWDNASDFAQRVEATQDAANALLQATQSGDADAVGTAQTALQQTCGDCHQQFRARPAGRAGN